MRAKMISHIVSLILVSITAFGLIFLFNRQEPVQNIQPDDNIRSFLSMDFIDYNDPFQQALFMDVLKIYQPENEKEAGTVLRLILDYRRDMIEKEMRAAHTRQSLNLKMLKYLFGAYLKFILIYIVVLFLTYYWVEILGIIRFTRKKQGKISYLFDLIRFLRTSPALSFSTVRRIFILLLKAVIRGVFYFIFFSPAYVLAYSFKTEFNTNTIIFLALLGLISNGLLITYTNKFYSFLMAESRKGYVLTALVKNLSDDYRLGKPGAISLKALFSIRKKFKNHVLNHIYLNAHYQYLGAFKEQASFLISGLIIIEMALNIHGHLSYELLQQLLYKNYDIVIVIVLSIFFIVKLTQIGADLAINKKDKLYNNEKNLVDR